MPIRRNPESGRRAVTLLATAFVVLIGATATAFLLLTVTERTSWVEWTVWGVMFGGVAVLIWLMYVPPDKQVIWQRLAFWIGARDSSDPLKDYQVRRRRTSRGPVGTNEPPTIESLRESAESPVKWVPRGPAPERPPRPGHSSS